jgi:5-methylthioadenosine/S-adenosylhomocysteine deaminase
MTLLRGLGEEPPLMEWLQQRIWPVEARLTPEHVFWGTRLALLEMVSAGVTCFADMYFFMDQVAEAALMAGMRCALSRGLVGADEAKIQEGVDLIRRYHDPNGLVTIQLGPHAIYTVPPAAFREISQTAGEFGVGVHTHWLETEWEARYIREELRKDPVDLLEEVGLHEVPFALLAHGVWFPEDRLRDLANSRLSIVHNPNSNLKLGSGVAPVPAFLEKNVRVALGTDGAASNNRLDVWDEMRTCSLLHKGIRRDPSIVLASEVLRMATLDGARALGLENVGLLKPGWQADLVLVDLDKPQYVGATPETLSASLVYSGSSADVTGTVVAGKWLYRDGVHLTLERETILEKAAACRKELLQG